jgi:IPT/TIG domain-containing protein
MRFLSCITALVAVMSLATTAAPALAEPDEGSCFPFCETEPPPQPEQTTIHRLSPDFGWTGDGITISGARLDGATVTVDGKPAKIQSNTGAELRFIVPAIEETVLGPQEVPVTVTSSHGAANATFLINQSLYVSAGTGFASDGRAHTTAEARRKDGKSEGTIVVHNYQWWSSLVVNVSVAWLDDKDRVIGYTLPKTVAVSGVFFSWPNGDPTASGRWTNETIGPHGAAAMRIHSGRILMVRDHEAELNSTLDDAVETAKTIWDVVMVLASFMGD